MVVAAARQVTANNQVLLACALQASKQRPWRRYDQCDAVTATAWLPAVTAPLTLLDSRGVSYRLDVELGRLEFEVHPYMTLEHQLVSRLSGLT